MTEAMSAKLTNSADFSVAPGLALAALLVVPGDNPEKIIGKGRGAGDCGNAVDFYRHVRLNGKINFHARGVLRIALNFFDTAHGRTAGIPDLSSGP